MKNRTSSQFSRGAAGPLLAPETARAWPQPPDWTELAACQYVGDDFWFPEKGGSVREAKRVCRACPVRTPCLDYALGNGERFGVWGGMSERERRRLLRQAAWPAAGNRHDCGRKEPGD